MPVTARLGVLDIKATIHTGEKVNIEVQLLNHHNLIQRTLFYWSKLYTENFQTGMNYKKLKRTVAINILGFNLKELNKEAFHSTYQLHEMQSKNSLTDLMEIHFIEYPKFENAKLDLSDQLHRWLLFLKEDAPENQLKEVVQMDQLLQKEEEKLSILSSDPETLREYQAREKALSDERTRLEGAEEEGILKVAKSFVDSGLPIHEVAKHTPYSAEELEQLLKRFE
ncbi:putative transposase/invertase (TIGR01784 family) [Bacillus fengqiuensis]|nr:putative transposase/invertase (TIGR01784 family) [Bacillus fengqiuensis]